MWFTSLSSSKCKRTIIGKRVRLNNDWDAMLGRTTKEKELGVTFSPEMKVSEKCGIAASKGSQSIGLIKRTLRYKETANYTPVQCNS